MNVGPGLASRYPAPAPIVPAYSLIVAGPPRVGKSALLRLLLDTAPISPHATQSQLESVARFIRATAEPRFAECQVEVLWHGERILLRLLDTPGLDFTPGNEDDCDRCLRDIISVVEDRYVEGARDVSPQSLPSCRLFTLSVPGMYGGRITYPLVSLRPRPSQYRLPLLPLLSHLPCLLLIFRLFPCSTTTVTQSTPR